MSYKAVIFCGGEGTRIREVSEKLPKPLISVEGEPIVIHIMKHYAEYGIKDFILCLGYKQEKFKDYFLRRSNVGEGDLSIINGEVSKDRDSINDWNVTLINTGIDCCIGERLFSVKKYLEDEDYFFVTYGDALSDVNPLKSLEVLKNKKSLVASITGVRPNSSFHLIDSNKDGIVNKISDTPHSNVWINGGFMCMTPLIFNYLNPGEELVIEAFDRLVEKNMLHVNKHFGYWYAMDTYKDYLELVKAFKNKVVL